LQVKKYFEQISEMMRLLREEVTDKIRQSDSLKELEKIIHDNKNLLPTADNNYLAEKQRFDDKIQKGRYAYLVKRQEFYQSMIKSLDQNQAHIKQTLAKSEE
jgi:hypothetical protein